MEINIQSLLGVAFEPGDGSADGAQLVDGEWYHPVLGCDSLQHVIDGFLYQLNRVHKDEHHTLDELYEHRHALTLALMKSMPERSWFSKRHEDGELCFGDEDWFIVGVNLPTSLPITYHLPSRLWKAAQATGALQLERGEHWDGYTSDDVVERLVGWAESRTYQLSEETLETLYEQVCNEITRVEDNND